MPNAVALKIHDLIAELEVDSLAPQGELHWLTESCEVPKAFWDGLVAYHSQWLAAPSKSVPFESYDLYHDLVTRNLGGDRAAFRWYDATERRWETFSFLELDTIVGRRAKEWEAHGVGAGQTVAIVDRVGPELLVALLTAFRLGAVVSLIPPTGEMAVTKRLEQAAPDHIATDPILLRLLGEQKAKAIPAELPAATESYQGSGIYATGTPAAKVFSPFAAKVHDAIPVTSDAFYLWALRDGVFAYSLKPGDTLLAAGTPLLSAQPALLLATLLTGATYVHVDLEQVEANPALVDGPFKSVAVTRELRDLVLESGAKLGRSWKSWFRFVEEGGDPSRWFDFMGAAGVDGTPLTNVHLDPGAGGCLFFSLRRKHKKGGPGSYVLPSPGTSWFLSGLARNGVRTATPMGYFTAKRPGQEETPPGDLLVRKERGELLFLGSQTPHRLGKTYPVDEVLAAIDSAPFVLEASIVTQPTGDPEVPWQFALAVFCGHELREELAEEGGTWRELIEEAIERELGSEALPDTIDFFPFYARRSNGLTDHAWCRDQFLSGNLHLHAREEPFTLLNELRTIALGWQPPQAPAPPPAEGEAPPPAEGEAPPPAEGEMPPPETPPPVEGEAPPPEGGAPPPEGEAPPPPEGGAPPPEGEAPPPPEGGAPETLPLVPEGMMPPAPEGDVAPLPFSEPASPPAEGEASPPPEGAAAPAPAAEGEVPPPPPPPEGEVSAPAAEAEVPPPPPPPEGEVSAPAPEGEIPPPPPPPEGEAPPAPEGEAPPPSEGEAPPPPEGEPANQPSDEGRVPSTDSESDVMLLMDDPEKPPPPSDDPDKSPAE